VIVYKEEEEEEEEEEEGACLTMSWLYSRLKRASRLSGLLLDALLAPAGERDVPAMSRDHCEVTLVQEELKISRLGRSWTYKVHCLQSIAVPLIMI
jgi:hypothetical protein